MVWIKYRFYPASACRGLLSPRPHEDEIAQSQLLPVQSGRPENKVAPGALGVLRAHRDFQRWCLPEPNLGENKRDPEKGNGISGREKKIG